MRIIARARTNSDGPLTSDAATCRAAHEPLQLHEPVQPRTLTGHSPRSALEALQKGGNVGRPLEGFEEAVALCKGRVRRLR